MRKHCFSLLLLGSAVCAPAALADSVTLDILNPVQTGPEGTMFTYEATVTNPNSVVEYLSGDSLNTAPGELQGDDTDFNQGFPQFLAPGDSFTGDLFTITATPGSAGTVTTGSFVLLGGPDPGDQIQLASEDFSATVTPAVAATPEPSSLMLLGTGVMGGVAALRRRRARA